MKKFLAVAVVLAALLLVAGCRKEENVTEEIVAENGNVVITSQRDEVCNYQFYLCYNDEKVLIPYTDNYSHMGAKVLKVTNDYVIIYCSELLRYNFADGKFSMITENIIDGSYNEDKSFFWWMDSELNGYVFDVNNEETKLVENVRGITRDFQGFYVNDSRGIKTLNGNMIVLEEVDAECIEKEGRAIKSYVEAKVGEHCIDERGVSFKYTDYIITNASEDARVVKILYRNVENSYEDTGAVLLEGDELIFYNFEEDTKTLLAEEVMPRTISASYGNLMWLDNNYTGHIILNMNESLEILSFENVLDTHSGSDSWNKFKTVPSDNRLQEYESIGNGFIVE